MKPLKALKAQFGFLLSWLAGLSLFDPKKQAHKFERPRGLSFAGREFLTLVGLLTESRLELSVRWVFGCVAPQSSQLGWII